MSEGCFLNPHIDNSHDRNLENYRRLNLLYYVNKDWISDDNGGDLTNNIIPSDSPMKLRVNP